MDVPDVILQHDDAPDEYEYDEIQGPSREYVPRLPDDVVLVLGGTIPQDDIAELKGLGVAEIFTPGAPTAEIVNFLKQKVPA